MNVSTKNDGAAAVFDKEQVANYLSKTAEGMNIHLSQPMQDLAVRTLFSNVQADHKGTIQKDEFGRIFDHKELESKPSNMLAQQRGHPTHPDEQAPIRPHHGTARRLLSKPQRWTNRQRKMFWFIIYGIALATSIIFPALKWAAHEEATAVFGNCIMVARSSANALNLHAALMLFPIARHFFTWIRLTPLRHVLLPVEASLDFHMLLGIVFACLTGSHVLAHVCDYKRFVDADIEDLAELAGDKLGSIPSSKAGRWGLLMKLRATTTGIAMLVLLMVGLVLMRYRRSNYNRFWTGHHLLIVMLVLMCVHGSGNILQDHRTVYWIGLPLALYIVPRIYRELKCASVHKGQKAEIHGDVLELKIAKPKGWQPIQRAGMYAFINIPSVARWEWHPISISSAPRQDHVHFHIRKAGDWTSKVHELFQTSATMPRIRIEGPIAAPAQEILDHPFVVLIGAGIGITPMVCAVRELLLKSSGCPKKIFLYWIVRDNTAFEWFNTALDEIYDAQELDTEGRLEVRYFVTSIRNNANSHMDLGASFFQYTMEAVHAEANVDIVLGHQTQTPVQAGRPHWEKELKSVVHMTRRMGYRRCAIFACGPESLTKDVRRMTKRLSKKNKDIRLHFSKETF